MEIKDLLNHIEMVYKSRHRKNIKGYDLLLGEYTERMGLRTNQKLEMMFDNIIYNLSYRVPDKYKKSMKFALERELLENWIINRYGIDVYHVLLKKTISA
jgi:hypothetical protein